MEYIEFNGRMCPASYLGDGVYAIFDGFGIWLHANHHENPTDRVYLEPDVFENLKIFVKDSRSQQVINKVNELNKEQE